MRTLISCVIAVALLAWKLIAAEPVIDTSGSYLPFLDLPKEKLSTELQKVVESVKTSKVPSTREALRAVLSFADDRVDYMGRADIGVGANTLLPVGREVLGFASASDFVWVVHATTMDKKLLQVFYVSTGTGKVLPVFPEAPTRTVQRTGASRSAQGTNSTSSATDSRR